MTLPDKIVALDQALEVAFIPHAFGGALALAWWTLDPRGTSDIDLNLFVPAADPRPALEALPTGVAWGEDTEASVVRDEQVRLWWDETPVDLFFNAVDLHEQAMRNTKRVAFLDREIPILGATELAVFKLMYDRTRDWADLEAMATAGTLDIESVRETISTMVDAEDERIPKLEELRSLIP